MDLAAEAQIDKDNPPDLKALADAAPTLVQEEAGNAAAAAAPATAGGAAAAKPAAPAAGGGGKKTDGKKAGGPAAAAPAGPRGDDLQRSADAILERIQKGEAEAAAAGGADGGKGGSSGLAALDADALRRLRADLAMELNTLRNAAYARGFKAARAGVVSSITGQHAA